MKEKAVRKKDGIWADEYMKSLVLVMLVSGGIVADMVRRKIDPFPGVPLYLFLGALVMTIEHYSKLRRQSE